MSIVDILVYLDTSVACGDRMALAALLARRFDAYLTGVGLEEATLVGDRFANLLRQDDLQGEWRLVIGTAAGFVTRIASTVDLVVLGQRDPDHSTGLDAPEEVIVDCGRPVLIVPSGRRVDTLGERVLIAWNNSREAMRAMHDALPLLAQSSEVLIVWVNPEHGDDKGLADDVAAHLSRHGLNVRPEVITSPIAATADTLLARAADARVDLIVMGAYGHSRLREKLLGGVTHDVLRDSSLPVLMAH
jgi:nucleotide-binding universal stress UspA family protein